MTSRGNRFTWATEAISRSAFAPNKIQTIVGTGVTGASGDGGPAIAAKTEPVSTAVGPDGSLYVVEFAPCIRRVTPDGIIHTFAGQCTSTGFSGDGGPATSAQLNMPSDIAFGPDGSLYIADTDNARIRRVYPNGIIQTVAGSGTPPAEFQACWAGFSGDGGPATQATLSAWGVDVAADGSIYIADGCKGRIRRVTPDGIIRTVAGNNNSCPALTAKGYGGPATAAGICTPIAVRVAKDGGFYISEAHGATVDHVGTDGIIRVFAGNGTQALPHTGDGGPATAATLEGPYGLAVASDGSLLIDDGTTIRRVDQAGIITTIAGQPTKNGFAGDNGPATAATLATTNEGVSVAPDGTFYVCDIGAGRVRRISPTLPGSLSSSQYALASSDGKQIQIFDGNGRALSIVDTYTNATLYEFSYDGGGRLATVMDFAGNVTTINRDSGGNPLNIAGAFGEQTTLRLDSNGYLASVTDPAGQQTKFTYDASGLMQTMTDAREGLHQFSFDAQGRLSEDQDPAGGSKSLVPSSVGGGFSVAVTTAFGVQSAYQTAMSSTGIMSRLNTLPNGLQSSMTFAPSATVTTSVPDGTTTIATPTPDPLFGMFAPTYSTTTKTPSGLSFVENISRAATLNSNNHVSQFTEITSVNGNTWTRVFNAGTSTWTTTSPAGRVSTMTVDAAERPTQVSIANVAPVNFVYDSHGRLLTTTQATRVWTQGYDSQGYLASLSDPLNHATSYVNDPVGRPKQTMLADGRLLGTVYDGDNNITQITLPSGEPHGFSFTPVDLLASYEPPSVSSASPSTQYVYDVDRELQTVNRPDGVTLGYGYDSAGRLQTTTIPQGTVTLAYNPSTGHLQSSTAPSGEVIQYAFDGFLKTGETWSGPVAGALALGFDNNFRMTSQTVNGTALGFGYDHGRVAHRSRGAHTDTRPPERTADRHHLGLRDRHLRLRRQRPVRELLRRVQRGHAVLRERHARRGRKDHPEDRDGTGHDPCMGVHFRRRRPPDGRDRGRPVLLALRLRRGRQPHDVHERQRYGEPDVRRAGPAHRVRQRDLRVHARRRAYEQERQRAGDELHVRSAGKLAARGTADGVGDRLRGRWREPAGREEARRDAQRGVPLPGWAQRRGAARWEREPRGAVRVREQAERAGLLHDVGGDVPDLERPPREPAARS